MSTKKSYFNIFIFLFVFVIAIVTSYFFTNFEKELGQVKRGLLLNDSGDTDLRGDFENEIRKLKSTLYKDDILKALNIIKNELPETVYDDFRDIDYDWWIIFETYNIVSENLEHTKVKIQTKTIIRNFNH